MVSYEGAGCEKPYCTETHTVVSTALQAASMEKQWCWCNAVMKIDVPTTSGMEKAHSTFCLLEICCSFSSAKRSRGPESKPVCFGSSPHTCLFPLGAQEKRGHKRPAGTLMFSIHCISMVILKCPLLVFCLFTFKWELQVLVCRVAIAHNEKWQGCSISGVLSVHRLPAEKPSKVGTWVDIFS